MTRRVSFAGIVLVASLAGALAAGGANSSGGGGRVPATPSFASPKTYATGVLPQAVSIAEVDGYRPPDLAVASANNLDTVSVLLNQGHGIFAPRREYPTGRGARAIATGDLDGDRHGDVVTANADANTVSVLLNRSFGVDFTTRHDYSTGRGPLAVTVADVNGDRVLDVVTANVKGYSVSVLLGRSHGTFAPHVDYRTGRRPDALAVADLNGDGRPDLATANLSVSLSVLLNHGDGTFPDHVDYRAGSGPRAIAAGDLNGDGKPDLATANYSSPTSSVTVFLDRGDGSLRPARTYRSPAEDGDFVASAIAIGDLNRDRRPELVVAGGAIAVYLNQGSGTFQPAIEYPSPVATGSDAVALGDLNGDGAIDVVTLNGGANSVSVLLNQPSRSAVPNVVGRPLAEAEQVLVAARYRVGTISRAYSRLVAPGRVIEQHPRAGATLAHGGRVNLVVSRRTS